MTLTRIQLVYRIIREIGSLIDAIKSDCTNELNPRTIRKFMADKKSYRPFKMVTTF